MELHNTVRALNDKFPSVKNSSAEALGKIGDLRAVDPLLELLKDDHMGPRSNAAEALGELKDTRAVEPLISTL